MARPTQREVEMKPRERVMAALRHEEPDRVPISFGDVVISSIFDAPPYGYRALCAHLGIDDYAEPIVAEDAPEAVLNVDERLRLRLGADLRWIGPESSFVPEHLDADTVRDEWGLVRHRAGAYWDLVEAEAPLASATSIRDLDDYAHWPSVRDPRITAGKRAEAQALRDAGYAVVAVPGWAIQIFYNYFALRGFSRWLLDIYDDPILYRALVERIVQLDIDYLSTFLGPIGDLVDIVVMAEDLGTQDSTFMSPAAYREFCKPYQATWIEAARRLAPDARIMLHSCGAIRPLVPDFIEVGFDILNPLQPRARGMDLAALKREFGSELSLIGGLDIQELLPFGSAAEVRDGARALIDTLGPGGGYIFAPSHQIQPDVPPENIISMYDAALEVGRYPLAAQQPRSQGDRAR
jgi:uroporphyrinogen decarboxylase